MSSRGNGAAAESVKRAIIRRAAPQSGSCFTIRLTRDIHRKKRTVVCIFLLMLLRLDRFISSRSTCNWRENDVRAFQSDSLIFTRVASRAASRFVCRASEDTSRVSSRKREREREASEAVVLSDRRTTKKKMRRNSVSH